MTDSERDHIRHIARLARFTRRDLRIGTDISKVIDVLEEIENSARHALADCLHTIER